MKRAIIVSLLVCALVAAAGCLEDGDTDATTMSVAEFSNDYNTAQDQANGTVTFWLGSVDEGDTLVIEDTIASITYDEQNQSTTVTFTSKSNQPFRFEGNITGEFSPGDNVSVTVHIINVTMEQSNPQTGQTITYYYETFEEGWDAANETSVPFPQSTIEHIESIDDTDDTDDNDDGGDDTSNISGLTFSEFWNDYSQSVDNQTMTAITYLESFDEGDTVTITDQLQQLSYNATNDYTVVQFASLQQRALTVEGDITGEFQTGDTVTLTSGIINATFNYQMQDKNWTIHYETFEDGWDTENNRQTAFPQAALQHAEG